MEPAPQPQIAVDPNLKAEQERAKRDQIEALKMQAQGDTASIMARYGARLALSGAMSGPIAPGAA